MNRKVVSLSKLYKNVYIRNTIWDLLAEDFDDAFERLIKEAMAVLSLLAKPAKLNKDKLKELYIEYGFEMENLEDLKKMLEDIKALEQVEDSDDTTTLNC